MAPCWSHICLIQWNFLAEGADMQNCLYHINCALRFGPCMEKQKLAFHLSSVLNCS